MKFYDVIDDDLLIKDSDKAGDNPATLSVEERTDLHYQQKALNALSDVELSPTPTVDDTKNDNTPLDANQEY